MGKWQRPNWTPQSDRSQSAIPRVSNLFDGLPTNGNRPGATPFQREQSDTSQRKKPATSASSQTDSTVAAPSNTWSAEASRINPYATVLQSRAPTLSKTTDSAVPSQANPRQAERPRRINPFAEVLKSDASAIDIENDLFAGITAAIPSEKPALKPAPKPAPKPRSMIDSFIAAATPSEKPVSKPRSMLDTFIGAAASTATRTSEARTEFTKTSQPFRISDNSKQKILDTAQKSQAQAARAERPVRQLGFMAAAATRRNGIESDEPKPFISQSTQDNSVVESSEAQDGIKRVDPSQWSSSSREKWTYEINSNEVKLLEKQRLEEEAKNIIIPDSIKTPDAKYKMTKHELKQLRARTMGARMKTGISDLGVYTPPQQKIEAPPEINVQRDLYIPPSISVSNFANLMKVPLCMVLLARLI